MQICLQKTLFANRNANEIQALVGAFKYEPNDALGCLTYYYSSLQEPKYTVKEMLQEISEQNLFGSLKQANLVLGIITKFCNGIPKFILKGNTSSEVFNKRNEVYNDFSVMSGYMDSIISKPYVAGQKIRPNDPCPCGSGKKYKKCSGQSN